jgi:hypothetical protein
MKPVAENESRHLNEYMAYLTLVERVERFNVSWVQIRMLGKNQTEIKEPDGPRQNHPLPKYSFRMGLAGSTVPRRD